MDIELKARLQAGDPVLWINPQKVGAAQATGPARPEKVVEANSNWAKLTPLLQHCFPQLESTNGTLTSDLVELIPNDQEFGFAQGHYFLKADHNLPVAGSVKARGGIYEVFMHALSLARSLKLLSTTDPIQDLASPRVKATFEEYSVVVGSTGNLGLSVGLAARALGFQAVVHMSSDAKPWKVERLRRNGVQVVQHQADYGSAVAAARNEAAEDPSIYFVDDERSELLFYGYSAAASELQQQLTERGIKVNRDNPLFLYLPCGIGGAPGGIAFGIKQEFGDHAHCFFAEPSQAPCALVQLASGLDKPVSVYDIGLTNKTEADGMAVAEVSQFVAQVMQPLLSGVYTVRDDNLFRWLSLVWRKTGQQLEPSAAACLGGPAALFASVEGQKYLTHNQLETMMRNATHVMWATGGSLVPAEEFSRFENKGASLLEAPLS